LYIENASAAWLIEFCQVNRAHGLEGASVNNNWTPVLKNITFIGLMIGGAFTLYASLMASPSIDRPESFQPNSSLQQSISAVAKEVDASFGERWKKRKIEPTRRADELIVARRLSLGLSGTIPSLQELRALEEQAPGERIYYWVSRLLEDERTSDYLAERFSRAFVGVEGGAFIVYRRRRFVSWLSDQIAQNRPYNELVNELLTKEGLWTDSPAVNFYTRAIVPDSADESKPDPVLLAGRTSRAFLGMRIDCLQCHDDFLGNIDLGDPEDVRGGEQTDFHQLAAFFAGTENSVIGIRDRDNENTKYEYKLLGADEESVLEPKVPFYPELLDESLNRRNRLAQWVTHPENRPFSRSVVNRVWAIMFGGGLIDPVDDIPLAGPFPDAMEVLVDDFVANGFDLHRLIRVIAETKVFQLESKADFDVQSSHTANLAVFPLERLRPDQMAGAIIQASSLKPIDKDSHIVMQLTKFGQVNEFVVRYGDPGENEFEERGETVTQRLLMLNGNLVQDRIDEGIYSPVHVAGLSPNSEKAIETVYLCVLTRRPTPKELAHFMNVLGESQGDERGRRIRDIFWALLNSTEFGWNH
jgi:hypothetical protein